MFSLLGGCSTILVRIRSTYQPAGVRVCGSGDLLGEKTSLIRYLFNLSRRKEVQTFSICKQMLRKNKFIRLDTSYSISRLSAFKISENLFDTITWLVDMRNIDQDANRIMTKAY